MSLFISSLNTGSNGNCFYVGNASDAVLIDAGISCRETERRMQRLNLSMKIVKAIFVSHEHSDHITGICGLSKKYSLPVYITNSTLSSSGLPIDRSLVRAFQAHKPVPVGALSVTPFPKFHDAADPHSFMVSGHKINVGIFTDIGTPCANVVRYFRKCHAAFLESNYCEDMLLNGSYPFFLKQRIHGDQGHLSNTQALQLFLNSKGTHLTHLILSHLSKNNNKPELVEQIFREKAGAVNIAVASRYEETSVYTIGTATTRMKNSMPVAQLSLF